MDRIENTFSIRERMHRALELRKEYGANIPQELLDEINYVSIEDENGQLTLMTSELFAKKSLEKTLQKEADRPPFETIAFRADSSLEIGARIPLNALHAKIEDTYLKLGYAGYNNDGRYEPCRSAIAERYPQLAQFVARFEIERSQIAARYLNLPQPIDQEIIDDLEDSGSDLLTSMAIAICHDRPSDISDYESRTSVWWKSDNAHVPPEAAHRIFTINQQTRAALTDAPELTRYIRPEFELDTAFGGLPFEDEDGEWLRLPEHITGWEVAKQALSHLLQEDGFIAAAQAIDRAAAFDDVVAIVDSPTLAAECLTRLKLEQKELRTTIANPHERFAKQSQLKNQIKAAHQTVTSLRQLFHFDQTYADYAAKTLNALDDTLLHKSSTDGITIELDARPDAVRDGNPGKMSGDCTEGKPLPFGKVPGLRNIKVSVGGEYLGNIYSYQTTSANSESVWHFDAIQIPQRTIDWQTFPAKFIAAIEPYARENNIDMITINSRQYHISNYDYVAKGFMQYLQADTPAVEYDNMEQPSTADDIQGEHIQTVSIKFPDTPIDTHYSQLQGVNSRQIVLWKNPNQSSDE
jgi:hypothetical protein